MLLHGLFGVGRNLGGLERHLRDRFHVLSVDLPNHGRSGWLLEPDLPRMADAVWQQLTAEGITSAHLIGHSLGGKVAMEMALQAPSRAASLVAVDIAPVAYPARHDAVFTALEEVAEGSCTSREEAADIMARHLEEEGVILFLLMSLQRQADGTFDWRFDLPGLRKAYPSLLAAPTADSVYPGPVLFIKGEQSDYLHEDYRDDIAALFPQSDVRVLAGTGHWLHIEKADQFNALVLQFLTSDHGVK